MTRRREYGKKMGAGVSRMKREVMEGHWLHATTEALMERTVAYAGLSWADYCLPVKPEDADPEVGDLRNLALYYLVQAKLMKLRLSMKLPSGKRIVWRAVRNVRTGKPLDAKRAAESDAYALRGRWVPFKKLRADESEQVSGYYLGRENDSVTEKVVSSATRRVLSRHGPQTLVEEVWDEIAAEIDRAI